MTTLEVGKQLVELCKAGKNEQCMETLYSPDIVAIEAHAPPGMQAESRGKQAIIGKGKWWSENHTVHSSAIDGPYPSGDRFIVKFTYDVTNKPSNKRFQMEEMALYTVANGKIVREEFFYTGM